MYKDKNNGVSGGRDTSMEDGGRINPSVISGD